MNIRNFCMLGALLAASLSAQGAACAQDSAEKYFEGKTITVVIPGSPGADRARNALPFIEFFGKHVPGHPLVIASYMPGAGGAVGMNYLYNVAPRTGLFIGSPLAAFVIAQVTGDKSAKYDVSKMNWIGRTTDSSQILYVWHTTGLTDLAGAKQKTVTIGSSGANSASTILPLIMNQTLGTKFKIIQGYDGSAAFNLSVERGETDGALTTWGNMKTNYLAWVKDGRARLLVQLSLIKNPDLANVPLAMDLASNAQDKALLEFACSSADLGESFIAPPGVPPEILAALRHAFDDTMKDPDYIAATRKEKIDINPMTGQQLTELTQKTLAVSKEIVASYQAAVTAGTR